MTATSIDEDPYRNMRYIDTKAAITAQMTGAVELLYRWKRWNAVIAGGALWSWAAGFTANDVDIFVRSTWWSRRRARAMYGLSSLDTATVNQRIPDGYGGFAVGMGLQVFKTKLANHPTKVDFVLSGRTTDRYGGIFDYAHCQVGYGLSWHCIEGANSYCEGKLTQLHADARGRDFVMNKVQQTLWRNPNARARLVSVMQELSRISGKPLRTARPFPALL